LGIKINENLESYKFNWNLFVDKIESNTSQESIEQVAKYSYFTATVMQKDFGTGHHVLKNGFQDYKDILQAHFKCQVNVYQFSDGSFIKEKNAVIKTIKEEINDTRPVAFWFGNQFDWGHAVVIDGYLEKGGQFLVHINQGLGGSGNGVYNLFSPIIPSYGDMYWREILTIRPKK
jgi:stress-induced morphogen